MDEQKSPRMQILLRTAKSFGLLVPRGHSGVRKGISRVVRYGFAGAVSGIAVWLRLLMNLEVHNDAMRMLSIVAIALAAWLGGFGPGLLATVIGLAGSFLVVTAFPAHSFGHIFRLFLFGVTGLIVSGLTEALTQTTAQWRRAEEARENQILQERNRMAREIHDTLAQGLTGILIQLEAADDILDDPNCVAEVRAHLTRAQDLSRRSLSEARRSVSALRPLALEGQSLPEALSSQLASMTEGTGTEAHLIVEGKPYALPADAEDNLLRIGLEAVTNALKHAGVRTIPVRLTFGIADVQLLVRDEGSGFTVSAPLPGGGFGLPGMAERAERIGGRLTITSSPGKGTEVAVTVPCASAATL